MTLIVLRVVGVDPQDQRPGLWLAGDVVDSPVSDWSFTDDHYEIYLQTNTPYFVPHSVTVYCATLEETSIFYPPITRVEPILICVRGTEILSGTQGSGCGLGASYMIKSELCVRRVDT